MARRKKTYKCYTCGKHYTFETGRTNADGTFSIGMGTSTRAVILGTSRIHDCSKVTPDNISGDTVTPEPVTPYTPPNPYGSGVLPEPVAEPEPTPEPENTPEPEPEPDRRKLDAVSQAIFDSIEPAIDDKLDALYQTLRDTVKTINHRIETVIDGTITAIDGAHRQTEFLLRLASVRVGKENAHLNIMLVGPAGTGKTSVSKTVADFLGREFFAVSVGPQSTKTDFFGYTDAVGRPIWSVIRDAYVNGGVLLLDEFDSATAGALTYLNAILANDVCYFPSAGDSDKKTTKESKHRDFLCIAGCNTYGKGLDPMYNGRQQLDAATLDRFVGINWDYDTDMERALFPAHFSSDALEPEQPTIDTTPHIGSGMLFGDFVWRLRRAQKDANLRLVYGMRKVINGCALLDAVSKDGKPIFTRAEVEAAVLWFGVSPNERLSLLAKISEQPRTGAHR